MGSREGSVLHQEGSGSLVWLIPTRVAPQMIDLRFVSRDGKSVLQVRYIPLQIGWSTSDDRPVIEPKGPLSLRSESNWTEWEDVPVVREESDLLNLSDKT